MNGWTTCAGRRTMIPGRPCAICGSFTHTHRIRRPTMPSPRHILSSFHRTLIDRKREELRNAAPLRTITATYTRRFPRPLSRDLVLISTLDTLLFRFAQRAGHHPFSLSQRAFLRNAGNFLLSLARG